MNRLLHRLRTALLPGDTPMTTLAILFCAGWYVAVGLQGPTFTPLDGYTLLRAGANSGPLVLHGEPWRVATYAWLHGDLLHLAMNMLALVQIGPAIERFLGSPRFALLYPLCAIAGGAASALVTGGMSVGASGAVFGIAGAGIVVLTRVGTAPALRARANLVFWLGLFIVLGFAGPVFGMQLDNMAHLGGLAVGLSLAWLWTRPGGRPAPRASLPLRVAAGVVATAFVVAPLAQQWMWREVVADRGQTPAQTQAARLAAWAPCREAITETSPSEALRPCLAFRRTAFEVVPAYELMAELYAAADRPQRAARELALLAALGGTPTVPHSEGDAMVIAMRAAAMERVLSSVTPERVTAE